MSRLPPDKTVSVPREVLVDPDRIVVNPAVEATIRPDVLIAGLRKEFDELKARFEQHCHPYTDSGGVNFSEGMSLLNFKNLLGRMNDYEAGLMIYLQDPHGVSDEPTPPPYPSHTGPPISS